MIIEKITERIVSFPPKRESRKKPIKTGYPSPPARGQALRGYDTQLLEKLSLSFKEQ